MTATSLIDAELAWIPRGRRPRPRLTCGNLRVLWKRELDREERAPCGMSVLQPLRLVLLQIGARPSSREHFSGVRSGFSRATYVTCRRPREGHPYCGLRLEFGRLGKGRLAVRAVVLAVRGGALCKGR